jgi:hypothetical protein
MNRSIEVRLKKLESLAMPERQLRRSHLFAAQTDQERHAAIAALVAGGADPDDFFIQLVAAEPITGATIDEGGQYCFAVAL